MTMSRALSMITFDNEFGSLHRTIFADRSIDEGPFVNPTWRMVLLPYGSNMTAQDFESMCVAAQECGDTEIVVKDAETIGPTEAAVVCDAAYDAFQAAKRRPGSVLGLMDIHIFGRSARWGCVCAASLDDIAVLGGEAKFVRRFIESAGGEEVLRSRYHAFARSEWSIDQEMRVRLLKLAGWHEDDESRS